MNQYVNGLHFYLMTQQEGKGPEVGEEMKPGGDWRVKGKKWGGWRGQKNERG